MVSPGDLARGWLTIWSAAAWTSGSLRLAFTPQKTRSPLAVSNPADATPRIDYAGRGQTYLVISGSARVELWLATLVHVAADFLTAHGTQDDDFHFDAGASCTITVNGVVYKFEDRRGRHSSSTPQGGCRLALHSPATASGGLAGRVVMSHGGRRSALIPSKPADSRTCSRTPREAASTRRFSTDRAVPTS